MPQRSKKEIVYKEKPEREKVWRWGFISVPKVEDPYSQVAVACVSLAGDNLEFYFLDLIRMFNFDPLQISITCLGIKALFFGIDAKYFNWLESSWQKEENRVFLSQVERRGSIPVLRDYKRDKAEKDPLIRQQSILLEVQQQNNLSIDTAISEELKAMIFQLGNPVSDAVAGAIMIAKDSRSDILHSRTIKPQPVEWYGLERIKH